jgi:alkanesulfonate monooxygenase SsuD/methylene tetrahydromethanopterin reductase-like flavin-dependent oxidoreductase (luciferase family)
VHTTDPNVCGHQNRRFNVADPLNQITPTNWVPTRSIVGGAGAGTAAAQLIVALADHYFNPPLGPELASAITTLCIAVAGYLIPDGKRST